MKKLKFPVNSVDEGVEITFLKGYLAITEHLKFT